jgi:hypothetical protein
MVSNPQLIYGRVVRRGPPSTDEWNYPKTNQTYKHSPVEFFMARYPGLINSSDD